MNTRHIRPWRIDVSSRRLLDQCQPKCASPTSRSCGICGIILGSLKRCTIDHTAMEAALCFGFRKSEWKDLKKRLEEDDDDAWLKAIGVFERRMRERFFSSIDALFAADSKPDMSPSAAGGADHCIPGFAIMALCCLLIDTLQGFRERPPRMVKIFKCAERSRSSMMDVEDEHNHMRAAFGLRDRFGQPGTPARE